MYLNLIDTVSNTLLQLLSELTGLLPADATPLFKMMRPVKLEAGEAYIREGDTSKRLAFIERGIVRAYSIKQNGEEATLFVRWDGQLIASHDTIIHQKPARFIYRAVEPTQLLEMDYDVLESVLREHPEYEPLRNHFLMHMLADTLHAIEAFVLLSPQERYEQLVANRPEIVNRVPDKYIASILGVTPVSLSRIRRRIGGKG